MEYGFEKRQLVFGAEYDFFEREDGYDALCDAYGFIFKETMDMDIGLKYQAINEGKIDVMVIFTTDGQLSVSDVTVLEDDKNFYPSYLCGNVIRSEVLEEHPELAKIFNKLTGVISDKDMAELRCRERGKRAKRSSRNVFAKCKSFEMR